MPRDMFTQGLPTPWVTLPSPPRSSDISRSYLYEVSGLLVSLPHPHYLLLLDFATNTCIDPHVLAPVGS